MSEDLRPQHRLIGDMIDKICNNKNAFFKSQQKDEKDLNIDEKRIIVENLFRDKKELFLQRYGSFLTSEELNYFDDLEDNLNIRTVVNSLRDNMVRNSSRCVVKNRRYQTLQKLIQSGHYFSDCQMQARNPLLFEQMVGQYMSEEEKTKMLNEKYSQDHNSVTLSAFLMEQIDKNYMNDLMEKQKSDEEIEEFDSDSDTESEGEICDQLNLPKDKVDETQKQELKEEFKKIMAERFLEGKDKEFYDYNQCDSNTDLDINHILDQDIEDRYFDEDDRD